MSDTPPKDHHPATTVGQTAGLPGDNADPRTRVVPADEVAPTTAATGDGTDGPGPAGDRA